LTTHHIANNHIVYLVAYKMSNNKGSDGGGSIQGDEPSYDSHNWDYTEPDFDEEYSRSNRYSWENRSDNIPWCPRELIEHPEEKPATSSSGKTETARKEGHAKGSKGKRGKDYSSKS
jgi:Ser-tRNA(Ala) deacylase AlaX